MSSRIGQTGIVLGRKRFLARVHRSTCTSNAYVVGTRKCISDRQRDRIFDSSCGKILFFRRFFETPTGSFPPSRALEIAIYELGKRNNRFNRRHERLRVHRCRLVRDGRPLASNYRVDPCSLSMYPINCKSQMHSNYLRVWPGR